MLDTKTIRETPELVRAAIAKKHLDVDLAPVIAADAAWRVLLQEVETLRSKQKAANNEMAAMPKGSPEFKAKVAEMKEVSAQVKELDASLKVAEEALREHMLSVPNIPHSSVPEGSTPEDNVVYATNGDVAAVSAHAVPHYDVPGFQK